VASRHRDGACRLSPYVSVVSEDPDRQTDMQTDRRDGAVSQTSQASRRTETSTAVLTRGRERKPSHL